MGAGVKDRGHQQRGCNYNRVRFIITSTGHRNGESRINRNNKIFLLL